MTDLECLPRRFSYQIHVGNNLKISLNDFLPLFTVKDLASSEAQQRSLTAELDSVRAKLSEVGDERRRGKIHNFVIDVLMIFMLLRSRTWNRIQKGPV